MKTILFLLIVALFVGSDLGQNKSLEDLTLKLVVLKSKVLPMEPLAFELSLENRTISPVPFDSCFSLSSVSLEIKKPDGKVVTPSQVSFVSRGYHCGRILGPNLMPGTKRKTAELYGFEHYKYFSKPGEYKVRAVIKSGEMAVSSEWFDITVVEPMGTDKHAYEYLAKNMQDNPKEFMPFTLWQTKESRDVREEFVMNYPSTVYADYVRYELGRGFFEKEKMKSVSYFRAIDKGFVYAEDVAEQIEMLESQLKNPYRTQY